MKSRSILSCLLMCALTALCCSSQDLPVLIWSPERPLHEMPETDGFAPVETADFHDQLLLPILKREGESAVTFLQDKLHTDDFTKYADVYSPDSDGGAFTNIKNVMDEHFSLEMPKVVSPHVAIEQFKNSFAGDVFVVTSFMEVEKLDLGKDKRFLLIFNLSPVKDAADEEKAIQENDAVVGAVVRHLNKRSIRYTALFTGQSAGDQVAEDLEVHTNRHLMEAGGDADKPKETSGTFMNASDGNIFVFLYNMSVCYKLHPDPKDDTKSVCALSFRLQPTNHSADGSSQNARNATVKLLFENAKAENKSSMKVHSDSTFNIEMTFFIENYKNQWQLNRTYLTINATKAAPDDFTNVEDAPLISNQIFTSIPIPYSYHCAQYRWNVDYVRSKTYKDLKTTSLVLNNFQFQVYNITNNQFFQAEDCVGFFTNPIWMGLVPTGLLIFIILIGTIMTLNLSTMDRYDDPKGKTITVTVSE